MHTITLNALYIFFTHDFFRRYFSSDQKGQVTFHLTKDNLSQYEK